MYFSISIFFFNSILFTKEFLIFRGFRSLHGSVKQRERKKFLIYSIYAWGCAAILTGICAIMDFLPKIPNYLIKPDFGKMNCWFTSKFSRIRITSFLGQIRIFKINQDLIKIS